MNTFDLIRQAGPLFWVLLGLSIFVVYLAVTRFLLLNRLSKDVTPAVERVKMQASSHDIKAALSDLEHSLVQHPVIAIMQAGLRRYQKNPESMEAAMQTTSLAEEDKVYTGISTLSTIAQIAPLLGLLGTVIGMVRSFLVFSQTAAPTPNQLATGISEALVNTAAGLIVAIVAYVLRNVLRHHADQLMLQADQWREELVSCLSTHQVSMATQNAASKPPIPAAAPRSAQGQAAAPPTPLRGRPLPEVALSFDSRTGNVRATQTLHDGVPSEPSQSGQSSQPSQSSQTFGRVASEKSEK